jgi:predicted subunit of tRNA(5-methylaminomethyl-2-thiouridylate) methyltransferase
MTDAGVLYSGGKDSSLAAIMLGTYYEVELNTFTFDPARPLPAVEAAARSLGFPWKRRVFEQGLLNEAADMVQRDGFPNGAINRIHRAAVEALCARYAVVADGTRFNDRVPMLTRAEVQSIEGRTGCSCVRPLLGFTKSEVDRLADRFLLVSHGETGTILNGDYEAEIREAMAARGIDPAPLFPPRHDQSLVIGRKPA